MKTIGLVTYYNSDNFGAMLQAYALQNEIVRNNCECIIIEHNKFSSHNNEHLNHSSTKKSKIKKILRTAIEYPRSIIFYMSLFSRRIKEGKNRQMRKCATFRETNFHNRSNEFFYSTKQITNNPPVYDGYVCGSDQIWNPERFEGAEPFYLSFVPDGRNRIAYAPSLAMTYIPENLKSKYKVLLSKFTDLSVREEKGCLAIEEVIGTKPARVLDPTFLMSKSEWEQFGNKTIDISKQYLFCYFLGKENLLRARIAINKLAKKINAEIIVLPFGGHVIDKKWRSIADVGPKEFVDLIKNAKYVMTDSFHGTAISVILNKPFNVYAGQNSTAFMNRFDRIDNILKICGLESRTFTSCKDINTSIIDYKSVNKKINTMVLQSKDFLKCALDKVKEQNENRTNRVPELASYESCTGCSACFSVCPRDAIQMSTDKAGFWRPNIKKALCMQCGKCESNCPVIHPIKIYHESDVYVGLYAKDSLFRAKGSSGNAFGLFSKNIIKSGGVVFGAALSDDCRTLHMSSSSMVGLEKLQKSKYFEADMGNVIEQIRTALDSGKEVMFTGTPCQAAGVRKVFGNNSHLLICDFICHGVPSAKWFEKYLTQMESRYKSKATDVSFRSKALGWRLYCMKITFSNGKQYLKTRYSDPFYIDFFSNKHLRTNCYSCNRILNSYADVTFGDYWAANVKRNIEDNDEGISVVALRTIKGKDFFEKNINNDLAYVRYLSKNDVDKTFVSRVRKLPDNCDSLPEDFDFHPRLKFKEHIYRLYAEVVLKNMIKLKVRLLKRN